MTWDASKPAGTQKIRLSDEEIRANWDALEDALGRDHNFAGIEGTDAGEHTRVKFYAPISTPTNAANKCFLYAKDVSSKVELHWLDEDGNEIQLTDAGVLNGRTDIPSGEIILFEKDTSVTGYTLQTDVDDKLVFISKGSAESGEEGGTNHSTGTWTQPDHTLTVAEIPSHRHGNVGNTTGTASGPGPRGVDDGGYSDYTGGGGAHNHGTTWRPAARVFTRQERD